MTCTSFPHIKNEDDTPAVGLICIIWFNNSKLEGVENMSLSVCLVNKLKAHELK